MSSISFSIPSSLAVSGTITTSTLTSFTGQNEVIQVGGTTALTITVSTLAVALAGNLSVNGIGANTFSGTVMVSGHNSAFPSSGAGLNLHYDQTNGVAFTQAYDFDGAAWKLLRVKGSSVEIFTGGSLAATFNSSQGLSIAGATASTSTSTGALIVAGGVGIAGAVYSGGVVVSTSGEIRTQGYNASVNQGVVWLDSGSSNYIYNNSGTIILHAGGADVITATSLGSTLAGSVSITGTTASTSTTTGSLINAGGFGNAGAAYIGGKLQILGDGTSSQAMGSTMMLGGVAADSTLGSIQFGDGTGYKFKIGTWSGGAFASRFTLLDTGAITLGGASSITAAASTDLTLAGGSSGASLVLGQGAGGGATITTQGNGSVFTTIHASASNGSSLNAIGAHIGSDGTLGSLNVILGGRPSATGSSRFGYVVAGDSAAYRPLLLGGDGSGFANVLIGGTTDISGSGNLVVFGTKIKISNGTSGTLYLSDDEYKYLTTLPSSGDYLALAANPFSSGLQLGFSATGDPAVFNSKLTITPAGVTTIHATTASTSTTTGALVVSGGVGVAGALYVGGTIVSGGTGSGATLAAGSIDVTKDIGIASTQGIVQGGTRIVAFTSGNVGMTGNLTVSGTSGITVSVAGTNALVTVSDSIRSISLFENNGTYGIYDNTALSNRLVFTGSTGDATFSNNLTVTGNLTVSGGNIFSAGLSSSLILNGGDGGAGTNVVEFKRYDGVSLSTYVRGDGALYLGNTTASTSTTTGALVVAGGIGAGGNSHIGGDLYSYSFTSTDQITAGGGISIQRAAICFLDWSPSDDTKTWRAYFNSNAYAPGDGRTWKLMYDGTDLLSVATSGNLTVTGTLALGASADAVLYRSAAAVLRSDGSLILGTGISAVARLQLAGSYSRTAWTTNGTVFRTAGGTATDTSSSGTVAAQVMNAFGADVMAASSSTTYTDAANLYIEGNVTAGSNVTITNAWGLWNVGNTRLDGLVVKKAGQGWGVTSTATAAGTTTLSISSTAIQIFTGSSTQTVQLPAANVGGTGVGVVYIIINKSSGAVTLQRAGSDTISGSNTYVLTGGGNQSVILISDGSSSWNIA